MPRTSPPAGGVAALGDALSARAPRARARRPPESLIVGKTTGRREWLSMVARGAAASTVGVLGSARAARSNDVGGDPRIKHIVVLMMENRSFDHMFGLLMSEIPDLRGVREGEWTNADDQGN